MNHFTKYISAFALVITVFSALSPLAAMARFPFPYWGGGGGDPALVECAQDGSPGTDCNFCELIALFQRLLYLGLTVLLLVIVPVLISIGGFYILVDMGSEERYRRGRQIVKGTVYGLAIALGSFLIVNTVITVLGITVGSGGNWAQIDCT